MIIDYNFFGFQHDGCVWDTPVCTDMLDELQLNQGTYDELYIDLDTNITDTTAKPTIWTLTTLMDSKFNGDLDGGSIGADGFAVNKIQLYRTVAGSGDWKPVGQFDYTPEFNVYDYVDRYVQNGSVYQYAIVPVANEVLGDKLTSDVIQCFYEGMFITDKNENRKFEYDIRLGEVSYNTSSSTNQPLNGKFPIVIFGNSKYRSGNLSVLPVSSQTIEMAGSGINKFAEQLNRQEWLDFLNNGKAKVLRMDSGVLMLIVTQNAKAIHKDGELLRDLAELTFDYVEVGDIDFNMLIKNNLIANAFASKMTYDDFGGIIFE